MLKEIQNGGNFNRCTHSFSAIMHDLSLCSIRSFNVTTTGLRERKVIITKHNPHLQNGLASTSWHGFSPSLGNPKDYCHQVWWFPAQALHWTRHQAAALHGQHSEGTAASPAPHSCAVTPRAVKISFWLQPQREWPVLPSRRQSAVILKK